MTASIRNKALKYKTIKNSEGSLCSTKFIFNSNWKQSYFYDRISISNIAEQKERWTSSAVVELKHISPN